MSDPRRPIFIGLAGLAGAGKSTVAKRIEERFGGGAAILPFALPMKSMLRALYAGLDLSRAEIDRRLHGDLKGEPDPRLLGATPRHLMQTLATEWGRECVHPDLWVALWSGYAQQLMAIDGIEVVVADDVRFVNEVEAIRRFGGDVFRIRRDGFGSTPDAHASERMLTDEIARSMNIRDVTNPRAAIDGLQGERAAALILDWMHRARRGETG